MQLPGPGGLDVCDEQRSPRTVTRMRYTREGKANTASSRDSAENYSAIPYVNCAQNLRLHDVLLLSRPCAVKPRHACTSAAALRCFPKRVLANSISRDKRVYDNHAIGAFCVISMPASDSPERCQDRCMLPSSWQGGAIRHADELMII